MRYIPNTEEDIRDMLKEIGVQTVEELFKHIPNDLLLKDKLKIPEPLSELALLTHMKRMSAENANVCEYRSFLGGGIYYHFIPSFLTHLISRSEFYTSYTPYQPEISQGTLQAVFEYQTLMCMLLGMDVSNASLYDGATSTAEAVLMATRITRKNKIVISETVHPEYRSVIKTYSENGARQIIEIPFNEMGTTNNDLLLKALDSEVACVVIQSPNFFGIIEDLHMYEKIVHNENILFIVTFTEPISFGILRPPGDFDSDIVCGEGQSLGIAPGFGGPLLGILTSRERFLRNMPGRIVGKTVDKNGDRAFVLTLSAREQHIRREKARSNICTNEGLCALIATIFLAGLGKDGIKRLSLINHSRAEYAKRRLLEIDGINLKFQQATFNEFVLRLDNDPDEIVKALAYKKIIAGLPLKQFYKELSDCLLITVTEMNSSEDIDHLCSCLKEI